jgi:chromosomal replication initiation ATPase DnaA
MPLDYPNRIPPHQWTRVDMPRREVLKLVAHCSGWPIASLVGHRRVKGLARARQVAAWLLRHVCGCSFPEVGITMGKDHSTMVHACNTVDDEIRRGGPRADLLVMCIGYAAEAA